MFWIAEKFLAILLVKEYAAIGKSSPAVFSKQGSDVGALMTSQASELILTPKNFYIDNEETSVLHPVSGWRGIPLNRYRSQLTGERGPCHVDCPSIVLDVNCTGRRWIRENGRNVESGCLPGTLELYSQDYHREQARWSVTAGYTIGLRFTTETIERLAPELSHFDMTTKHDLVDPKIQWLIRELDDELHRAGYGDSVYAESISCALIALLARDYGNKKVAPQRAHGLSAGCRRKLVDYIEAHISEELSIAVLADEFGLSPEHFARCFSIAFGQPPHRYIRQRRIDIAYKMLTMSTRSIAEIAFEVGFSSQSHFSVAFRQQKGITPSQARLT